MRFPYVAIDKQPMSMMPRFALNLMLGNHSVEVSGLLDTGSAINVLPYEIGLRLGANWEDQTTTVPLVGSLGNFTAKALVALASHPQVTNNETIPLVFAWTQAPNAPVIFGQTNFFMEFDVCFYRSQGYFDVQLKAD